MVGKIDVERLADMLNIHCSLLEAKSCTEKHSHVCSEELKRMLEAALKLSAENLHPVMDAAHLRSPDCLDDLNLVSSARNIVERMIKFAPHDDNDDIDEQMFIAADSGYEYAFNMLSGLPHMVSLVTRKHFQEREAERARLLLDKQHAREQKGHMAAEKQAKLAEIEQRRPAGGELGDYLVWVGEKEHVISQYRKYGV